MADNTRRGAPTNRSRSRSAAQRSSTSYRRGRQFESTAAHQITYSGPLIRDNPFPPRALRLAGSAFVRLKNSDAGRNREECWQNCEEDGDIG